MPEAYDERLQPGFRGGKSLFLFFLCNAVPFSALVYYLKSERAERAQLSLHSLPETAEEVVAEVLRVIRTSPTCFLSQGTDAVSSVRVDPHAPEGRPYVPPTGPLPIVPQMGRNEITDLLESPPVAGLGYIHFALARSSTLGKAVLSGNRRANLLYVSPARGAYCNIGGHLSVLTDPESRRRYWKTWWVATLPAGRESEQEQTEPWKTSEYVLVRFAVDDASIQSMVDGPQVWDFRRVRLSYGDKQASDSSWVLAP